MGTRSLVISAVKRRANLSYSCIASQVLRTVFISTLG